jgi:hypothetical protein
MIAQSASSEETDAQEPEQLLTVTALGSYLVEICRPDATFYLRC